MNQNVYNLMQANTTINLAALSPKQILGQCIDLATLMLKELISHYIQNNNAPNNFTQKIDFSALINYMLENNRLDSILNLYVKSQQKGSKHMVKSWLHQLKYMRNCWAHSNHITIRIAIRSFDTLSLIYQAFSGDTDAELFKKIEYYRKNLVITQAKEYVTNM